MEKIKEQIFTKVYSNDVEQYGSIRAIILGLIKSWCSTNEKSKRHFHEDFYWSGYIKEETIAEQTGLPYSTVRKNLKWLVDNNVVIKGRFNKRKNDKTGWYRAVTTVPIGQSSPSPQDSSHRPNRTVGTVPIGQSSLSPQDGTLPTIPPTTQLNNKKTTNTHTIPPTNPDWEKEFLKEAIKEKVLNKNLQYVLFELISKNNITRTQKDLIIENLPQLKKQIPALEEFLNNIN